MLINQELIGTEEIGLVTPTPGKGQPQIVMDGVGPS